MSKVFTITEGLENMGAIRSGGQGSVYKGRRIGEIITAIKLLPTPIFTENESDRHYRDFTNEVKKLQRVNEKPNPNIVKILSYGVSETGGFPFIEMEYIDGPDLGELLKEPNKPVFTIEEAIKVADHLTNALAHCHRLDVKHGDIKSNNVKYNQHTGNYVLLDFGLAILSDEERRTSLRHAGAIEFMAPEQNEGKMYFETDVYSFGIILYELLAGRVPFPLDGNSETARNKVMIAHMETQPPDLLALRASMLPANWTDEKKAQEMRVPGWLLKLVYKCLEKNPANRFADGGLLRSFMLHQRLHTTEAVHPVNTKDSKSQSVLPGNDAELQDLKNTIVMQEQELTRLRQSTGGKSALNGKGRKVVSKSAFNAVLLALLVVGGLAIYSLFFSRPVVGAANTGTAAIVDSPNKPGTGAGVLRSENSGAAKQQSKANKKTDHATPPITAATSAEKAKTTSKQEKAGVTKNERPATANDEESEAAISEKPSETNNTGLFKVRDKAFFHNEPDAATRREAFIVHWNKATLKPLEEKNGFVYVVFTNHLGQVSKGWLSKADLIAVK